MFWEIFWGCFAAMWAMCGLITLVAVFLMEYQDEGKITGAGFFACIAMGLFGPICLGIELAAQTEREIEEDS